MLSEAKSWKKPCGVITVVCKNAKLEIVVVVHFYTHWARLGKKGSSSLQPNLLCCLFPPKKWGLKFTATIKKCENERVGLNWTAKNKIPIFPPTLNSSSGAPKNVAALVFELLSITCWTLGHILVGRCSLFRPIFPKFSREFPTHNISGTKAKTTWLHAEN